MVESKSKPNIHFTKLNKEELSNKIALLVSNRSRIIFWKSTPHFYEGLAFNLKKEQGLVLSLSNVISLKKFANEKICLNCVIEDIDYFFSAKIVEHDDENQMIFIELFEDCFRLEKRSRERLQAYPKYDVYAYIKYFIDAPKNVISFNKNEQKSNDFLSKLNDDRLKKLISDAELFDIGEEEDIVGFRVEDISSTGISFFASVAEKNKIIDSLQDKKFSFTINFGAQPFSINDAKVVYVIDYINPEFKGVTMYKVGVSFTHSPSLKRKIEDESGLDLNINDYRKEFEEFIKND